MRKVVFDNLEYSSRVSKLAYDVYILEGGKEKAIWYDDTVLYFVLDNRFEYYCTASGNVKLFHKTLNEGVESNGYHADKVRNFLERCNLRTDRAIQKAQINGVLQILSKNYYEDQIYDRRYHKWLEFTPTACNLFSITLEYLDKVIAKNKIK